LALEAKSQGNDWAPFLEKLRDLAGKEIVLRRIFVQSLHQILFLILPAAAILAISGNKGRMPTTTICYKVRTRARPGGSICYWCWRRMFRVASIP